ncbi:hypothetical protein [Salicibibacter kimchii]|uniref:Small peptidoglycan-associated lipoprotein n=1 Tax=Salicibibacter kimchii TaxID=2099786 RepID=A0A345BX38_9BACI|nr:hypothetical protein [Salicibibacter kimchii]AXF55519.1 hypothetical protein DT065_05450 [Salicibibacter kimchii]
MIAKKTIAIAIIFAIITISTSCSDSGEIKKLEAVPSTEEPQAVLFIDENHPAIERRYYDALIHFQHTSDIKTDVTIIREQEDKFDTYEVEELPSLMLMNEDESVTVISGEASTERLIKILQDNFNER